MAVKPTAHRKKYWVSWFTSSPTIPALSGYAMQSGEREYDKYGKETPNYSYCAYLIADNELRVEEFLNDICDDVDMRVCAIAGRATSTDRYAITKAYETPEYPAMSDKDIVSNLCTRITRLYRQRANNSGESSEVQTIIAEQQMNYVFELWQQRAMSQNDDGNHYARYWLKMYGTSFSQVLGIMMFAAPVGYCTMTDHQVTVFSLLDSRFTIRQSRMEIETSLYVLDGKNKLTLKDAAYPLIEMFSRVMVEIFKTWKSS